MSDENKIKILGEENFRILEVLKLTREGAEQLDRKNRELKIIADTASAQAKTLEQKCAKYEREIARLGEGGTETQKALLESESALAAIKSEKDRLENEKLQLNKDFETKSAEETRLLRKIQVLEAEYAQKEAEIKANAAARAQKAEAQQTEVHRLIIEKHEARHKMAEESEQRLEEEKKALASELAWKVAEEARLSASLQEAGETIEKLNARLLRMDEELQNANRHSGVLQSEKAQLEEEKQVALKLNAEKAASLVDLEEIKKRLGSELEARSKEIGSLKNEIRQLAEISEQRQDRIQSLEDEKLNLGKDLEAKAAEEARLLGKIQGLETRYTQREAEIKANEEAMAQQAEKQAEKHHLAIKEHEVKHRMAEEVKRNLEREKKVLTSELAGKVADEARLKASLHDTGGVLEKLNARVLELEEELRNVNKHFGALQSEKEQLEEEKRAAFKLDAQKTASLTALERIKERLESEKKRLEGETRNLGKDLESKVAEEIRLLGKIQGLEVRYAQKEAEIKKGEAAAAEQREAHRLAIEEHEARHRTAEEAERSLEEVKKALAAELAGKMAEGARLKVNLQEAGGALEELNARVLELEEGLQNANNHSGVLQSEKERLEEEKQVVLKLNAEKTASLAALEEIKERLESEKKCLEGEKRNLVRDLEARVTEESRLLGKIKGLEVRYAQKEAEIKAAAAATAQQAEKHRLANEEHEESYRRVEEARRNLEREKKALAAEFARKVAEETRLRTSLQEADGALEKRDAHVLELEGKLQNANSHAGVLQSEKERLEEERQFAIKLDAEKTAALAALEEIKERLESEKKRLEEEKQNLRKDFEAKAAEEARLLGKIQGLEARHAQKEVEIKAGAAAMAQQAEKHRLAIKAGEAAMAQQAEKHRFAIKTNEEAVAQQTEKHRLVIKVYEARHRMAEEAKQNFEKEKKALASELARKVAEEARLRASLQEAGATIEKLNARVLELKEEFQSLNKNSKALQSEKERLEEEKRAALKLDAEKTASLADLKEIKERLESEKKRLEGEKRNLGKDLESKVAEEVRLLGKIQGLEARYAQKEAEIKTGETAMAQQAEKHCLAIKANEKAMEEQAEKQVEKYRLAVKEYEAKCRMVEEERRNLEREKKVLTSELAGKAAEETRLRANLQEAGGTLEQLNLRVLELEKELQDANKSSMALQSEKEQLEEERRVALKLNEEKNAAIATLENDKKLSENERQRLWAEKRSSEEKQERLENERLRLEKALEDRSAQADAQLEKFTKRCAELDGAIDQARNEQDRRARMVEDLTKTVKKMEALLNEGDTVQAALEEELKQEREMRVKVQDHSKFLEATLLALEKKIDAIL